MKFLRFGVFVLITFAVAAHGVVEVWSESIFEAGAGLLFLAWGIIEATADEGSVYWIQLNWPLLAFFAWAIVQLVLRLTMYPYLTWTSLLRWGACYLIFFVATQAFRDRDEIRSLTWFFVVLGFVVALEGIIQHFTSTGSIYWFRELELGGEPFGPFVNRNHFAGLMELLIPTGLAFLLLRGVRRDLVPLTGLLTLVPVAAIFLSASRGGLVVFIFEVALMLVVFRMRRGGSLRLGPAIAFLLALAALVGWLGAGRMLERFSGNRPGEVTISRRWSMARGSMHVFMAHPLTGTGLGTLIVAYPKFETAYDGKVVNHSHNDYAETLAELGVPGLLIGLAWIWLLYSGSLAALKPEQSHFSTAYHVAALVACSGMLLHSFIDFNLHIPSNALIFLILAALSVSPSLPPENPTHRNKRTSQRHSRVDTVIPTSS